MAQKQYCVNTCTVITVSWKSHFHKIPFDSKYLQQSFFLSEDPI